MKDRLISRADIAATIDFAMGFDPHLTIHDTSRGPVPIGPIGQPIAEVLL